VTAGARLAGIELGGTKSIAILSVDSAIVDRWQIATQGPEDTLAALRRRIDEWQTADALDALGIASFGPLQLNRAAGGFGDMLPTPKPGWTGAAVARALTDDLPCPWIIDTDVNGAALAEYRRVADRPDILCYVTIGTGVGGGFVVAGKPVHGLMHPELGHLRIRRPASDAFAGACPFHGDCLEGLVSGPALAARFGADPATVGDHDPRWGDVARDLAEMCVAVLLTTSAGRILLGGSVAMRRPFLIPTIRAHVLDMLGGYLTFFTNETAGHIIAPATLGDDAGPMGAIALAEAALELP